MFPSSLFWFFFYFYFSFFFFSFFETVLLYSSGWPEIHYVVRLALNLWQSPCLSSVEIIGLSWKYGFKVQHLPTACSRIWVSFTALFSSFSTNKQTNNISDRDWQLTSGILAHQLRIRNSYESILCVTEWWKEYPWLAHPKGTDRTSQLYSRNQRDIPEGCQKPT